MMPAKMNPALPGSNKRTRVSPLNDAEGSSPSSMYALSLSSTSRQIRVFKLHSIDNLYDKAITGDLEVIDLGEKPSFNALSYRWGEYASPVRDTISCGAPTPSKFKYEPSF
jgi:hypothetical protein